MKTKTILTNNLCENNIDSLYVKLCKLLEDNGQHIVSRGMAVKELIGVSIVLTEPKRRFLENSARNLKLYYAIGEFLWYLRGSNDLSEIEYYAPSMAKFSDDGSILQGAYGPKIVPLIDDLIQLLKNDTGTRRAVIPLYSADDLGKESKDIPCTLSLEFLIRNNKLHLITNMRSNDIFLGLPYDIFSFTMLQEYIAYQLGVDLGCYYHYVGSLHVYQRNFKKIEEISQMSPHETAIFNKSDSIFKNFSEIIDLEESIRKNKTFNHNLNLLMESDFQKIKTELENYRYSREKNVERKTDIYMRY